MNRPAAYVNPASDIRVLPSVCQSQHPYRDDNRKPIKGAHLDLLAD